jgi:hypothetical protein
MTAQASSDQTVRCRTISTAPAASRRRKYSGNRPHMR